MTFSSKSSSSLNARLSDGLVTLRPFTLDDAATHVAGDDEASIKWLNKGHKSTIESTRAWIERNAAFWKNDGPVFNFAIRNTVDDKLIGMIEANIGPLEGCQEGDANISYALYPEARGKGLATHAVNLVTRFLKEKGIKRAVIRINPENRESLGVPIRCGFEETKRLTTTEGEVMRVFVKRLL